MSDATAYRGPGDTSKLGAAGWDTSEALPAVPARIVIIPAAQLAAPTVTMLADTTAIFQLKEPPYTRYQSDGATLVAVGAGEAGQIDLALQAFGIAVQEQIQDAQNFAINRANHDPATFDLAANIKFAAGETLESMRVPFLSQGTGPSPDAPNLTAPPTISGSTTVGSTLTATPGAVTDGLGGSHTNLWQWVRVNLTNGETTIAGSTAITHVLTAGDNGFRMEVKQTVVDAVTGIPGNTRTSVATAVVGGAVPANSSLPTVSPTGTHEAGVQQYTFNAGTWTNTPTSYSYQPQIAGNNVGSPIVTASTSTTFTPNPTGPFGALTVEVIASNANGPSTMAESTSSVTVSEPVSTGYLWTDVTPAMWAEIAADNSGDPNKAGYEARVAAMPTTGGITLGSSGNISNSTFTDDLVFLANGGNYTVTSMVTLSGARKLLVKPGHVATIDCAGASVSSAHFNITGTNNMIGGVGSGVLIIKNLRENGVQMFGTANGGIARHISFQDGVLRGGGAGLSLFYDAKNCIGVSCEVLRLRDDGDGGDTDGYNLANNDAVGATNHLIDCHSDQCSDDACDSWQSDRPQFDSFCSWRRSGKHPTGPNGDGNGRKYGTGSAGNGTHSSYKPSTLDCASYGFNDNAYGGSPRLRLPNPSGDDAGPYAGGSGLYTIITT